MNQMKSVSVRELSGRALDYAVARAQGWVNYPSDSVEGGDTWHLDKDRAPFGRTVRASCFQPSIFWADGGPILDRFRIDTIHCEAAGGQEFWLGRKHQNNQLQCQASGDTKLIAGLRCFVVSELGANVDVPEELLK